MADDAGKLEENSVSLPTFTSQSYLLLTVTCKILGPLVHSAVSCARK